MHFLTITLLKSCKFKTCVSTARRAISSLLNVDVAPNTGDPNLLMFSPTWKESDEKLRATVLQDMQVYPEFITEREEIALLNELEPQLRRMRYEFDHWDNAIQGYRETERTQWTEENSVVLSRVRGLAFGADGDTLPHVHVLDLAAAGHIKPHVDAVRFCGDVIAGLCLVSSAVMRLQHSQRSELVLDALLSRRALYVMKGVARYDFTHAVLGGDDSQWAGRPLPRQRRVAVICRSRPRRDQDAAPPDQTKSRYQPDKEADL
ncbi:unnamed protein product [Chrysodeixis includens]|uniref:Alpha-ketoglutarate-dependent dioxygenase AlkB-like domain-containing protein n=1 Tax=Chrysodeixis includens TaxID=689277 RepID=A0A9P0BS93_CHRIL|nr:unnamed protein product [Chrysodeixis includens]